MAKNKSLSGSGPTGDPRDMQSQLPTTTEAGGDKTSGKHPGLHSQRSEPGNEGHSGLPIKSDGTVRSTVSKA